jgi:hypothetical protein
VAEVQHSAGVVEKEKGRERGQQKEKGTGWVEEMVLGAVF